MICPNAVMPGLEAGVEKLVLMGFAIDELDLTNLSSSVFSACLFLAIDTGTAGLEKTCSS